ncbi:hypothetical protein BDV36DRAFT_248500 [Aspergillus pseudocaelatus]|uniref:Phospholipase D n=1 Tax=Aspergillus pseudocaelatus TaxID=1825620 RepID=A0ABQ6WVQ0_9EURO|nr:hypothetical protein BDV36DRAFT_248500 [Aspergillus pseudocaelatus]
MIRFLYSMMQSIFPLVRLLLALDLLNLGVASSAQRPIYAIAHRVLRKEAVSAALSHGANALEVDLTAWYFDWWADHDGKLFSAGATARELFQFIAQQRWINNYNISFVWLDIKNPDFCQRHRRCSIEALRDLARETLEPAGIRVLYGFFQTAESRGFKVIRDGLNPNEAIVLSGETNTILHLYNSTGSGIPVPQMVMDFGDSWLRKGVDIYPELRYGSWKRDQGKLGKVFSWTSAQGDTEMVKYLLREAGIDGLIYGYQTDEYNDKSGPKSALKDIVDFVETHSDTHRMATEDDAPW